MHRGLIVAVAAAAVGAASLPAPAQAGSGSVAAGVIGGFAAGAMVGAAMAHPRPYYYGPAPVYVAPPPRCYWTRGEPVWDPYYGVWRRSRVRVCD